MQRELDTCRCGWGHRARRFRQLVMGERMGFHCPQGGIPEDLVCPLTGSPASRLWTCYKGRIPTALHLWKRVSVSWVFFLCEMPCAVLSICIVERLGCLSAELQAEGSKPCLALHYLSPDMHAAAANAPSLPFWGFEYPSHPSQRGFMAAELLCFSPRLCFFGHLLLTWIA